MGSLSRVSVVVGDKHQVPAAPLAEHFERLASSQEIALRYHDETNEVAISYAELEAKSNALARALTLRARTKGPNRDGDYVIAICMEPTHETVLSILASWKSGAAYVPMEPSFPQSRINHFLDDAQPSLIIYDESGNSSMFNESGVPSVSFQELLRDSTGLQTDKLREDEVLSRSTPKSVAIVLYTSGSTGIPIGVRLSYDAICNRLWWQFSEFPYSETENTCVWKTALTFLDSVCEMWGPLLKGKALLILPREVTRDPQRLVTILAEYEVQRLVLVPTLLRSILMYISLKPSEIPLKQLKLWVCSGETLSKELSREFFKCFDEKMGYKLANFYGSTEVSGDITYHVLEKPQHFEVFPNIPIGSPIYNNAIYLLDKEMNPVREGEIGELWVSGANLALGYVGGQASEKFLDNPHASHPDFSRLYRTGDFGVLEKGVVLYAGRTDSQVKIRGQKVDLQEVERAVYAVSEVDKCVVLCYGLASGNPEILAFVTLKDNARTSAHHIEAALKNTLIHFMQPQVIVIKAVPLLVSGKVDRQALLKMYENTNNNDDTQIEQEFDYRGVEPDQMEKARVLFSTVGSVLGRAARAPISVRASFYALGGSSLNSIYTITALRDKGYYIQISDFLSATNLGEVLQKLSTNPDCKVDKSEPRFSAEPMRDEHKDAVIDMIVSSFYKNAKLKLFSKHDIDRSDYADLIGAYWSALVEAQLSVILKDASNTPVAVALNVDARDEPEIPLKGKFGKFMTFLKCIETSVRDTKLPKGKGTILHSSMMATSSKLSPWDNVSAITGLEYATLKIARERRFKGIFATNTSPLTQQLGTDVLGFETLLDYRLNQYVDHKGCRTFESAPDDMRAVVCWKPVD